MLDMKFILWTCLDQLRDPLCLHEDLFQLQVGNPVKFATWRWTLAVVKDPLIAGITKSLPVAAYSLSTVVVEETVTVSIQRKNAKDCALEEELLHLKVCACLARSGFNKIYHGLTMMLAIKHHKKLSSFSDGPPGSNSVCEEAKDTGPCTEFVTKWYYNKADGTCNRFHYGGCQGTGNRFDNEQLCKASCSNHQGGVSVYIIF